MSFTIVSLFKSFALMRAFAFSYKLSDNDNSSERTCVVNKGKVNIRINHKKTDKPAETHTLVHGTDS